MTTETRRPIEKLEVSKSTGVYHYTGHVSKYDEDHILVETLRGERMIFRNAQVDSRKIVGDETNGKESNYPLS